MGIRTASLVLLLAPMLARAGRRADEAFLTHACEQGRAPTELRLPRAVLPPMPPTTAPTSRPHPVFVLYLDGDQAHLDGVATDPSELPAAIATARATHPDRSWILAFAHDLTPGSWAPLLATIGPEVPRRIAVEAPPQPGPTSPDPSVAERLSEGRRALRDGVKEPFARLAALEALPLQLALPRADCPTFEAVLRMPLAPDDDCEGRVRDALTALDACALDRGDQDRALAVLGETWDPGDRARVVLIAAPARLVAREQTFGEALRRAAGPARSEESR